MGQEWSPEVMRPITWAIEVIYQAKCPTFSGSSLSNVCDFFLFFCFISLLFQYILVLDRQSENASYYEMSPWALEGFNGNFKVFLMKTKIPID